MNTPKFYDEKKVGTVFEPRYDEVINDALETRKTLKPSTKDKAGNRNALLAIDFQIGFCHKNTGTLYVPGSEDDIKRTISFLFNNLENITTIFSSLDTHLAFQIFFKTWFSDNKGKFPDYFTMLDKKMIESGQLMPTVDPVWTLDYIEKLKKQGNKDLCIWTFHTMLGTIGHALDPALFEAFFYHAIARVSQTSFLTKGNIPQTEMYGILSPEVQVPQHPMGGFNTSFLNLLTKHDKVFIVGEAKSHCVLESIKQIYNFFIKDDPDVLKKIYILEDCMSSVQHPAVDFEAITQAEFNKFRNSGINIVKSIDIKF